MSEMVSEYTIPTINVARNAFVRNHSWKGDLKVGFLYPVFFDEVLPGDTKQLDSTFFGRINPTVTAPFDNVWLDYHLFFVPNRLTWDNWQKFMGERKNPDDSIDYLVPTITAGANGFTRNELLDYFSVPPGVPYLSASSLIFYLRSYNLIWNEWYRSELYQNSVTVPTGDTGDSESIYKLLPRGKRQDYFTSAFAQPQLGTGASINITGNAPVIGNGHAIGLSTNLSSLNGNLVKDVYLNGTYGLNSGSSGDSYHLSGLNGYVKSSDSSNPTLPLVTNGIINGVSNNITLQDSYNYYVGLSSNPANSGLIADMSNVSPITINSLRMAIAVQQFLERDLMRGTRYVELILSHFGVRSPDYRLQRPEYLGGATTRINITPVTQVSSTDSTSPQGNISGNGVISASNSGFTHSFTEHGVVIGLVSLRTDLNYQQGIDRHFLRNSRYDYFFPTLAHLGMQGIYNKEIYAQGDSVTESDGTTIIDDELFGYNTRYEELRYKNSYITGTLRSSHPQSLDIWHFAENFSNLPVLNDEFIEVSDTLNRIMTVQDEPEVILDVWHEYTDVREVPMYGLPGLERI